jgi:asparagine synthase (glutamine-hydrolysing)
VCGFAGIVDLDGGAVDEAVVRSMGASLAHRGPDDQGHHFEPGVGFAHQRLAIIDLTADGRQPFSDASGRYHLVYNGEIYNYLELRDELAARGHRFRTRTDTEVLLAAYLEWGEECQRRLRGMWAFAIWDSRERRLFCSRDRFGIKPLFYRRSGARLELASELKAFLAVPGFAPALNLRLARDFLAYGRVEHDEETLVESVRRLPPAHSLTMDAGGLRLRRYWSLEQRPYDGRDAAADVRERLLEAVRIHLRSDVAVGTCLSGGIDSSAIACLVARLLATTEDAVAVGPRQRTFTATFPGEPFDEREHAEQVVAATGASPTWVTFDERDLLDVLPSIVWSQDEPFGSTSPAAQFFVMRAAREAGVKVMLDGQGGDETFAGYHTSFGPHLRDLLVRARLAAFLREAGALRRDHGFTTKGLLRAVATGLAREETVDRIRARESGATALFGPSLRSVRQGAAARAAAGQRDALHRQLHALLTRTQLPELLRYEDRNSMAHSLEARVPFLDHELVELAFSLPADQLIRDGVTKSVLRRAVPELPDAVRARRDKLGFFTPHDRYFSGGLGVLAEEVFADAATRDRGLVDVAEARRRLGQHRSGERRAGFELWRALNLELWARRFLDRGASSVTKAAAA